jgi:DNA-binding transcriptional MerR regulator
MGELLSIGGVAAAVQRSPALLRQLERSGVLPAPLRLTGSERRVYRAEDIPRIREILAGRRAPGRPSNEVREP